MWGGYYAEVLVRRKERLREGRYGGMSMHSSGDRCECGDGTVYVFDLCAIARMCTNERVVHQVNERKES